MVLERFWNAIERILALRERESGRVCNCHGYGTKTLSGEF